MKLKPEELKIGKKYFLIDYDNDKVIEGLFYNHDLYGDDESFDFKHSFSIDKDGDEDYEVIYLTMKDGILKENVGDRQNQSWVENPIFLTKEEAEAEKDKYILASLEADRELILKELEENTKQIEKLNNK